MWLQTFAQFCRYPDEFYIKRGVNTYCQKIYNCKPGKITWKRSKSVNIGCKMSTYRDWTGSKIGFITVQGKCTSKRLLQGEAFTSSNELVKFTSLKTTFLLCLLMIYCSVTAICVNTANNTNICFISCSTLNQ